MIREPIASPGYLKNYLLQVADPQTLPWKAIGAAAFGVVNSVLGVGALPLAWAVAGVWFFDMFFGIAAAFKRGGFAKLSAARAFDGLLKGTAILSLAAVAQLLEHSVREQASAAPEESGMAASIVLGVAMISLLISIRPNALELWKDAGVALDRVGAALGLSKNEEPAAGPAVTTRETTEETDG